MTGRLATAHQELEHKNTELTTALQNLQESRERLELLEQLKGELSKFVPEAVKRLLEQNPNATELEKKTVEVSVLFLDIAGYTKLSEQLEPRRLNQLVQTYFSSFLEIIQRQHGDINETAGDGLMVIFQAQPGAGRPRPERHARRLRHPAADGAAERGVRRRSFPRSACTWGSTAARRWWARPRSARAAGQRWTFTATGPTTNIAARFAGSAQAGEIIVGPTTADRIRSQFVLESLGERSFKNVSQPIRVFRVIPPGVYEKIV